MRKREILSCEKNLVWTCFTSFDFGWQLYSESVGVFLGLSFFACVRGVNTANILRVAVQKLYLLFVFVIFCRRKSAKKLHVKCWWNWLYKWLCVCVCECVCVCVYMQILICLEMTTRLLLRNVGWTHFWYFVFHFLGGVFAT